MTEAPIRVVSALACEDIRREEDGKIMAIGIIPPTLELQPEAGVRSLEEVRPVRLHFLLVVDFLATGTFEARFRLKRNGSASSIRKALTISVSERENGVPVPIGPFSFKPQPGDTGFILQNLVGEKWRRIGAWTIDPPVPDFEAQEE